MYVRTQLEALRARGEDTANIEKGVFVDLFDAYACASDKAFCDYIKNLENGHDSWRDTKTAATKVAFPPITPAKILTHLFL
jgi:hypothetical protein